jgi:hypothetical protein
VPVLLVSPGTTGMGSLNDVEGGDMRDIIAIMQCRHLSDHLLLPGSSHLLRKSLEDQTWQGQLVSTADDCGLELGRRPMGQCIAIGAGNSECG